MLKKCYYHHHYQHHPTVIFFREFIKFRVIMSGMEHMTLFYRKYYWGYLDLLPLDELTLELFAKKWQNLRHDWVYNSQWQMRKLMPTERKELAQVALCWDMCLKKSLSCTQSSEWWNHCLTCLFILQETLWLSKRILIPLHSFWPVRRQEWASLYISCEFVWNQM